MTARQVTRRYVVLRGLRWMPLGMLLPFIILLPQARGLSLATIGVLWAVHSFVALVLEVPSGAFAAAFLAVYGIFGLGDPLHFELLHEATADDVRATVVSAEALAEQAGGGVGNLGLGIVAGAGGIPLAWTISAALIAATLLLVLRLPPARLTAADVHEVAAS